MDQKIIIDEVINGINESRNANVYNKEILINKVESLKNEFLFFIKPEITAESKKIKLPEILELIFNKMKEFHFQIKQIRILSAAYLKKYNIIAQHYGVINQISGNALNIMSLDCKNRFKELYNKDIHKCKVFGSLEFIEQYPCFTPISLDYLWQNSKTEKLGGGCYSQMLNFDSEQLFLINGFHPRQLEHFTLPGRSIIVFTLVSDTDWSIARNEFIGKTNPAEANNGSLRRVLLDNMEDYGLSAVNSSWNGVHLSAGPIEGLVEIIRYSSDFSTNKIKSPEDIVFGNKIIKEFGIEKTNDFIKNKTVEYNGKEISIFDLTEEKNSDDAMDLLKQVI